MRIKSFLFPFEKITQGSNIIIYGTGIIADSYLQQIQKTEYCHCVCFLNDFYDEDTVVDKSIKEFAIKKSADIGSLDYDFVVIASSQYNEELCERLRKHKVHEDKIVSAIHEIYIEKQKEPHISDLSAANSWTDYYEAAEAISGNEFDTYFKPVLEKYTDLNFDHVLDFACGRGRIAQYMVPYAKKITCCDISTDAIAHCAKRFSASPCEFEFLVNKGTGTRLLPLPVKDATFSFVYSWDAMVHFDYRLLDWYISEFSRATKESGYVLMHHSNLSSDEVDCPKGNFWGKNPGGRAAVSSNDVAFIAANHGFHVCEQKITDWGIQKLDCISIFRKQKG